MKDLDIIYCKNCKFFNKKIVDKYSSIYSCNKKHCKCIPNDKPHLYCNQKCFESKDKEQ